MWLSDLSIRQPVFITMVVLAVMVVGGLSYSRLGLDLFPDMSLPVTVVRTVYPGANPEEVEQAVTKPIEEAVASINGVETVRSTTLESISLVVVPVAYSLIDDLSQRLRPAALTSQPGRARLRRGLLAVGAGLAATAVLAVSTGRAHVVPAPAASTPTPAAVAVMSIPAAPALAPVALAAVAPTDPSPAPPGAPMVAPPVSPPRSSPTSARPAAARIANTGGLGANVRQAPGTSAAPIGALPEGAALQPLREAVDAAGRAWVEVRVPDGTAGWVASDYVTAVR